MPLDEQHCVHCITCRCETMRIELLPFVSSLVLQDSKIFESESEENCSVSSLSSQDKLLNQIPLEMLVAPGNTEDLGSTLAVPLGSTEDVLRPSLKRFSEEGRACKMCDNCWSEDLGCQAAKYVEEVY